MKLYHAGIIEAGHGPHTRSHYVVAESYDAAMALAERVGTVQQLVRPAEMPSYVPYHPVQPVRRWWWQR